MNIKNILKSLSRNVGSVVALALIVAGAAMAADLLFSPTPSAFEALVNFTAANNESLLAFVIIAVTLPLAFGQGQRDR